MGAFDHRPIANAEAFESGCGDATRKDAHDAADGRGGDRRWWRGGQERPGAPEVFWKAKPHTGDDWVDPEFARRLFRGTPLVADHVAQARNLARCRRWFGRGEGAQVRRDRPGGCDRVVVTNDFGDDVLVNLGVDGPKLGPRADRFVVIGWRGAILGGWKHTVLVVVCGERRHHACLLLAGAPILGATSRARGAGETSLGLQKTRLDCVRGRRCVASLTGTEEGFCAIEARAFKRLHYSFKPACRVSLCGRTEVVGGFEGVVDRLRSVLHPIGQPRSTSRQLHVARRPRPVGIFSPRADRPLRRCSRHLGTVRHGACCVR